MRIIIAEDELLERKAMKKFISDQFTTMEIVGEAANGRKAIELATSENPDLILMDIKMPGISGLEAIEAIHAAQPHIKFILISAYDSFAYAKEAMRYGIKDYILKPGKKEEIVQALLRVEKEIVAERQKRQETEQAEILLKQRFVEGVMHHPVTEEIKQLQKQLYPTWKSCTFLIMRSKDVTVLPDVLGQVKEISFIINKEEGLQAACVVSSHMMQKAELLQLAKRLQLQAEANTFIGIGDIYTSMDKLPDAYEQAYSSCLQRAQTQTSGYGFLQKETRTDESDVNVQHVYVKIEKGHSDQAGMSMKNYLEKATSSELEAFYIDVMKLLQSKGIQLEEGVFSLEQASNDWHAFAKLCAMKMNVYYQSKKYASQIEKYIREHFQEKISLHDAADAIALSPSYFSNLFKQEFGVNFTDYINRLRMDKAKTMIEENKLSIKEISYMLGYKDPNYFSRVFKKYYAESPKAFQNSILK